MKNHIGRVVFVTVAILTIGAGTVSVAAELTGDGGSSQPDPSSPYYDPRPSYQGQPSPFQQGILADGHVTDDEMQSAVDATLACLAKKGLEAIVPPGYPGTGVNRNILVVSPDRALIKSALNECDSQFMGPVEWRYAAERNTRTPVTPDEFIRIFDECMKARGFPSAPDGSDPNAFWTTDHMNMVAADQAGLQALDACFAEQK